MYSVVLELTTGLRVQAQSCLTLWWTEQKYWSGLPFPPPGDLSDPGIETTSPSAPAWAGRFFTTEPLGKPYS